MQKLLCLILAGACAMALASCTTPADETPSQPVAVTLPVEVEEPSAQPSESAEPNIGTKPIDQETDKPVISTPAPKPTPVPTEDVEPEPTQEVSEEPGYTLYFTEADVLMVAKILEVECPYVASMTQQAAVAWTICNRVDNGIGGYSIYSVCTYPNQYAYYPNTPVRDSMLWLARDVLTRWSMEKSGMTNVGRVIPSDYMWFRGTGVENIFRNSYKGGRIWDWSLPSPYAT